MKKRFSHKRNAFLTPRIFSGGSIVLAVVVVFALFRFVAPGAFLTVMAPVFFAGSYVYKNTSSVFVIFSNKQDLYNENRALTLQNGALINRNRALFARVDTLTTLIGTTTPRARGTVANVLARPMQSPYGTLIIDAGTMSKSAIGDVVTATGGVPIGAVKDVSPYVARVLLFSSPGVTTDAWVGTAHSPIALKGTGAGTFTASVPHQVNISNGDLVFVPGAPSFAIGRVVRIDAVTGEVMETLRIRPFVNIFSLSTVVVTHRTMP